MPSFEATTTITTDSEKLTASSSGEYGEVFRMTLSAPFGTATTGTFQEAIQTHTITSPGYARDLKYLLIKNIGVSALELHFTTEVWTDAAPDGNGAEAFTRYLIPVGDYMLLPNIRIVDWDTEATAAGAGIIDNTGFTPDSNLYVALDNIAVGDPQLVAEAIDGSETDIDVDDTSYFYPGDLFQVETEIFEVREIKSATALGCVRGAYGSSAASHSDDTAIRLPFFNAYHKYGDTSINGGGDGSAAKCKTDVQGRFKCFNMFGKARNANYAADGITPGSFAVQFRTEGGYQELGLSGITSSTNSGLAASTVYAINITVDGGTEFADLSFTTDSSNVNFGGTNGVLQKLQSAFDTQYRTAGNLYHRGVSVGVVNGDVRFSSLSNRSGSAISLANATGGSSETNLFGAGQIPAIGSVSPAIPKRFPSKFTNEKEITPKIGSMSSQNSSVKSNAGFAYDDGNGNITGAAQGTINYGSGAIDITGAPANADFEFYMSYGSALSGNIKTEDLNCNAVKEFRFRGVSWNQDATIEFIGMN